MGDQFLEAAVGVQQRAQRVADFLRARGFFDVDVRAGLDALLFGVGRRRSRQHRQRRFGKALLQLVNARGAGGVGQLQVQADQVGRAVLLDGRFDAADAVEFDHVGAGAQPAQQHHHGLAHQRDGRR